MYVAKTFHLSVCKIDIGMVLNSMIEQSFLSYIYLWNKSIT